MLVYTSDSRSRPAPICTNIKPITDRSATIPPSKCTCQYVSRVAVGDRDRQPHETFRADVPPWDAVGVGAPRDTAYRVTRDRAREAGRG